MTPRRSSRCISNRDGYEIATKKSVNGALMLYLDFINIFMSLVQLTGQRND